MRFYQFFFVLVFCLFFTGCLSDFNFKKVDEENIFKVGVMVPLSENSISRGKNILDVLNLSFSKINSEGGILGKQVVLYVFDSKCSRSGGKDAAEYFVNESIQFVVGGVCSSSVLGGKPVFDSNKILFISSIVGSPRLDIKDDLIFRVRPSDTKILNSLSNLILKENHSSIAIIYDSNNFDKEFVDDFEARLLLSGGKVISKPYLLDSSKIIDDFVLEVEALNYSTIVFLSNSEISTKFLISNFEKYDLNYYMYSNDLITNYNFIFFRDFLEGTKFSSFDVDLTGEKINTFFNDFSRTYKKNIFVLDSIFLMSATYDLPFVLKKSLDECDDNFAGLVVCSQNNLDNF